MTQTDTPRQARRFPGPDSDAWQHVTPGPENIVVQQFLPVETSDGGVVLPEQTQQYRPEGRIVKAGAAVPPDQVALGDVVMYVPNAKTDLPMMGKTGGICHYVLVHYKDITLRCPGDVLDLEDIA